MKVYVGNDIIEVDRIRESMRNEEFKKRVFTKEEIDYCEKKNENIRYQHYAARFAAKEAIFKAISPQLKNKYNIGWKNIEIINEESGRPKVNIKEIELNIQIDISISHIKDYAMATAVAVIY